MKRLVGALFLTGFLAACPQAFSFGIGATIGTDALGGQPGGDVMLSIRIPGLPIMWGIGTQITQVRASFVGTADLWLAPRVPPGSLSVYATPGLYLSFPDPLLAGVRLPVGIGRSIGKSLEFFVETAPTLIFYSSTGPAVPLSFRLQVTSGLRFWF